MITRTLLTVALWTACLACLVVVVKSNASQRQAHAQHAPTQPATNDYAPASH